MDTPTHQLKMPLKLPLKLPLSRADYQQATAQAAIQTDRAIAQQIQAETLAALAAHYYLKLLGIASELLDNTLRLSPSLSLRCVPIAAGHLSGRLSVHSSLYSQNLDDYCLGTLAVQVDFSRREAEMLGFVPKKFPALQPMAALINRLSDSPITHLQHWLTGKFEFGWQQLRQSRRQSQQRIATTQPVLTSCFRSANLNTAIRAPKIPPDEDSLLNIIRHSLDDEQRWQAAEQLWSLNPTHPESPILRAKDLGLYLEGHSVMLLVGILMKPNQERLILTRLLPFKETPYLPCNLSLTGLSETGDTVFSIQSRSQDDFIQFKFTAAAGDRFQLRISRNAASITEHFIV